MTPEQVKTSIAHAFKNLKHPTQQKGLIATPAEYTIGTNAAMPVAQNYISQLVPSEFRGMIPVRDVQQMVAQIVVAAINAVDASRAKQQ
jgi:hypothetical protein